MGTFHSCQVWEHPEKFCILYPWEVLTCWPSVLIILPESQKETLLEATGHYEVRRRGNLSVLPLQPFLTTSRPYFNAYLMEHSQLFVGLSQFFFTVHHIFIALTEGHCKWDMLTEKEKKKKNVLMEKNPKAFSPFFFFLT